MSFIILILFLFLSCCSLKKDKEVVKEVEEIVEDLDPDKEAYGHAFYCVDCWGDYPLIHVDESGRIIWKPVHLKYIGS